MEQPKRNNMVLSHSRCKEMTKGAIPTAALVLSLTIKKFTIMVAIKFETGKMDKGQLLVFPTVLVDTTEKAEKAKITIGFAWLCGFFIIGIGWTRKKKIAANESENK